MNPFKLIGCLLAVNALCVSLTLADSPSVKGTLDIKFNTRSQADEKGRPPEGVTDDYIVDLQVADTVLIQGKVKHLPHIFGSVIGTEKQESRVDYALDLSIANPANLSQRKRVGRLVGAVAINRKGVYNFDGGTVRIAVDATGKASEFESKFRGQAAGKPPKVGSMLERAKKESVTLTKQVRGKTVKLVVTDYDKMELSSLVLAAGPVKVYPETTVNGEMLYDYERNAWYFRNVTMTSQVDGKSVSDRLSGNIKWVESPQRKSTGEGEYQFDVRVNEPVAKEGEAEAFAKADDEAAFFEADDKLAALVGTAKYKDTISGGDSVTASTVKIELTGNNLNKQQVVALTKLVWLVGIVPMNSE